jgi:hypothetical protein
MQGTHLDPAVVEVGVLAVLLAARVVTVFIVILPQVLPDGLLSFGLKTAILFEPALVIGFTTLNYVVKSI